MRYEHIELDISTAACAAIEDALGFGTPEIADDFVRAEVENFHNELRARLQRRDVDPHCPKNATDWMET